MPIQVVASLAATYRYWILVPLSLIEGPVVAFASGTLASLGYFNIYALLAIFFARDLVMDAFYYALGYFGGHTSLARRLLRKFRVGEGQLEKMRLLWEKHPYRTIFLGKLSYGIAAPFVISAGLIRIRLTTFFKYSIWVTVTQFGGLLLLGYFFGGTLGNSIPGIIEKFQFLLAIVSVIIVAYYFGSWHLRKRFIKTHAAAE